MTIRELAAVLPEPYRAKQIFNWISRGALSFGSMTNLPGNLRKTLENNAVIRGSRVREKLEDTDGTVKIVLELEDGVLVETVLLPGKPGLPSKPGLLGKPGHFTACLSTQAGCPMGCVFCKTGSLGFSRNLETSEIVEQFLFLADHLAAKHAFFSGSSRKTEVLQEPHHQTEFRLSNIVVMGMGEPLLNLQALRKALEILCDPLGFGLSKRKITVSTSGIYEGILDLAENGPETKLALSIASAREDLRRDLMPGTARHPLSKIKEALMHYRKKNGRRITIETVLLGGINTTAEDAQALINFAGSLDAPVNLIPWNPVKDLCFMGQTIRQPDRKEIENFTRMLKEGGIGVTRRYRRGRSIKGACGQLGTIGKQQSEPCRNYRII